MRLALSVAVVTLALLAAGCSTEVTTSDNTGGVESQVRDGFANQRNVIVHDTSCGEDGDPDHFSCSVTYETAEGQTSTATVLVTCDSDRCVWREQ